MRHSVHGVGSLGDGGSGARDGGTPRQREDWLAAFATGPDLAVPQEV